MNPEEFVLVVQGPDAGGGQRCRGSGAAPVVLPTRVQVVGDTRLGAEAVVLCEELWSVVEAFGDPTKECQGPGGLGCWVSDSPAAHNVMVVLCGPGPHDQALEAVAADWLDRGFTVVGVLAAGADPQVSLPPALRASVALRYQASATETTDEIIDLALLAGEERRAFISYAHGDAADLAQVVFEALVRRRFDVYLDRFRTPPSADFVERIDNELHDKAMVLVIESAEAVASTWVAHEIMAARCHRFGLVAINVGAAPPHPLIPAGRRVSVDSFDEEWICTEVERLHRLAVVDQRLRRTASIEAALYLAMRTSPMALRLERSAQRVDLLDGGVDYTVEGSFRPAGVRQARRVAEVAEPGGRRPVLYCPRPARPAARRDLGWLDDETPVAVVPDGRLLEAARYMVRGEL